MEAGVRQRNGFGISALVLGIVAIVLAWTGAVGLILGILALIFGILALTKHQSKGFGLTGVILGGLAIIVAGIALLFQLVFIGAAVHEAAQASRNAPPSGSQTPASTSAHVGTPIPLSKSSIAVTATSITDPAQSGSQYLTPDNGNKYVAVNLTIENKGSTSYKDDADNDTSVVGSDNQTYTASLASVSGCTDFDNGQVNLSAGATVSGCITFEVPSNVSIARVQYTPNSGFSDDTAEWQNP